MVFYYVQMLAIKTRIMCTTACVHLALMPFIMEIRDRLLLVSIQHSIFGIVPPKMRILFSFRGFGLITETMHEYIKTRKLGLWFVCPQ